MAGLRSCLTPLKVRQRSRVSAVKYCRCQRLPLIFALCKDYGAKVLSAAGQANTFHLTAHDLPGRVLENGTNEFAKFIADHSVETLPGTRSIIIVDVHQVGSSCGFSVPFYDFKEFRPVLNDHFEKKRRKYEEEGKEDESMDQ